MADKKLFCANWKMNKTVEEALVYIKNLTTILKEEEFNAQDIIIFPNLCTIDSLWRTIGFYHYNIKLGGQNFYPVKSGAYTGETSIDILKSIGIEYFLIGHSERRHILGETQDFIDKKVLFAIENKVKIIYCFGEKLPDRKDNKIEEVIKQQLNVFNTIDLTNDIYFAYEPVWAIGTGIRATKQDITDMTTLVKDISKGKISKLIYGGSIDDKNVGELSNIKNISGYLVGSASLDPQKFAEIVRKG